MEFWLVYNSNIGLTLNQVNVTSRTTNFSTSFTLDTTNPAAVKAHVLVYTLSSATISPASGAIADLLFDVKSSATPGTTSSLSFSNANLTDDSGNPVPVDYTDTGTFTVMSPIKALLSVSDGSGLPGSTGNGITVGLDNSGTDAVTGVEFWVVYNSTVGITLNQVNTTTRTTNFRPMC